MTANTEALPLTPADNLARWRRDRLGFSLHLGLYSVAGRGEWVRSAERMSEADYRQLLDGFRPEPRWAAQWAALARKSGARHAVLTTKHHDGFCLFDSQLTDFKATNSPAGRDLVREWIEAVRAENLAVGLYYSLPDWHHPDYPAAGDRQHPLRHHPDSAARDASCSWSRYVAYLHGQLLELATNYGRIDSLVVDFSYWDYEGEKWGATEIQTAIRRLQPWILFNDRWGREPRKRIPRPSFAGDYEQTEQNIPREGLRDDAGAPMPWEAWVSLSNAWGFSLEDTPPKSSATLVRALVNCVSKDGNLLLDVSPDASGRIAPQQISSLDGLGDWLALNGSSIYGAGPAALPKPEWGRFTQQGSTLYAHLTEPAIGNISLPTLRGRVRNPRVLATGTQAVLADFWNPEVQTFDDPSDVFLNFARPTQGSYPIPDHRCTVVSLELNDDEQTRAERIRLDAARAQCLSARIPF